MTKITRTFIAFAAACLLAIMLMTVRCVAYDYSTITGTKASGAEISGYSGALEVNVVDFGADKKGKKDSSKAIQKALDYAIDNGSNSVQIKVVVPKGKYRISVCLGTACYVKGSGDIYNALMEKLGIVGGECTPDGKFSLDACRCVGACGLAPVMMINDEVYGRLTVDDLDDILAKYE